ncbi:hypothetical protein [Asticcacaulis solisilvae]|uniref:hypothetical protein n=1 Tax=Asticcacaulis solisilvae TaxID=1217274 RepID=UPI003FD76B58
MLARSFPLLTIPVIIYNGLIAATGSLTAGSEGAQTQLGRVLMHVPMPATGAQWAVSAGDIVMLIGLVTLFFEVISASRSADDVLLKHVLSTFLFILCLVEFLLFRPFATSTFFLLMAMTLMETIAGFIITTVAARKDIEFAH